MSASLPVAVSCPAGYGGTEFFIADCDNLPDQLILLALTGTSSLDGPSPELAISQQTVATEATSYAGAFAQPDGPRPLAAWIQQQTGGALPPEEYVDGGTACTQVLYADGRLWTSRTTVVKTANGPLTNGLAWYQIAPSVVGGQVAGNVLNQGYVAVDRNNLELPALTVDRSGRGVLGFVLYGSDYYPSAGYVRIDEQGTGPAVVVGAGTVPVDNFTGYAYFGSSDFVARYGDYGAAVTVSDGNYWIAQEYEPNAPRTLLSTWGTRITNIH